MGGLTGYTSGWVTVHAARNGGIATMTKPNEKKYSLKQVTQILEGYNRLLIDEIEELMITVLRKVIEEMNKL